MTSATEPPASTAFATPHGTTGRMSGWRVTRVRPYGASLSVSSRTRPSGAAASLLNPGTSESGDGFTSDAVETASAATAAPNAAARAAGSAATSSGSSAAEPTRDAANATNAPPSEAAATAL